MNPALFWGALRERERAYKYGKFRNNFPESHITERNSLFPLSISLYICIILSCVWWEKKILLFKTRTNCCHLPIVEKCLILSRGTTWLASMLKVNTQSDPGWKLRTTLAPERAPEGLGREGRRRERFRERSWEGLTIQIAQHEAPARRASWQEGLWALLRYDHGSCAVL